MSSEFAVLLKEQRIYKITETQGVVYWGRAVNSALSFLCCVIYSLSCRGHHYSSLAFYGCVILSATADSPTVLTSEGKIPVNRSRVVSTFLDVNRSASRESVFDGFLVN